MGRRAVTVIADKENGEKSVAIFAGKVMLFNFSASYSGGGYKRLYNYAKWFDLNGGATFIIHRKSIEIISEFPRNRYFIIDPGRWARLWRDGSYLKPILAKIPQPVLYYSYGIPLFARIGSVNWFHLSNALPVTRERVPMALVERLKFALLGRRIRNGLKYADVISAESQCSLGMIGREYGPRLFVSVNGFDDGLVQLGRIRAGAEEEIKENIAVLVGTYRYKALNDALCVFEALREKYPELRLRVFGPVDMVPKALRTHPSIELVGIQPPATIIETLRRARFYISTSLIENSSNADLEGAFLAGEAWLSDIGSHREMLAGSPCEQIRVLGMARPMLRVRGAELSSGTLKSWSQVIGEMLEHFTAVGISAMP